MGRREMRYRVIRGERERWGEKDEGGEGWRRERNEGEREVKWGVTKIRGEAV